MPDKVLIGLIALGSFLAFGAAIYAFFRFFDLLDNSGWSE